jgi:hypothetical protein
VLLSQLYYYLLFQTSPVIDIIAFFKTLNGLKESWNFWHVEQLRSAQILPY